MNKRVKAIVSKLRAFSFALWSHLGLLQYVLVAVVLTVLGVVVSLVIWSRVKPISEYRSGLENKIKTSLNADEVKIKNVSWAWEWSTFSLGIHAEDVEYRDEHRQISAAVPDLRVMWTPWKLLVGSVAITFHIDQSNWQTGRVQGDTLDTDPEVIGLFYQIKQPKFYERWIDVRVKGRSLSLATASSKHGLVLLDKVQADVSLLGLRNHFKGFIRAPMLKSSALGSLDGTLDFVFNGAFQYVDQTLVGITVDRVKVDFSDSVIDGWGLYKTRHDPLDAISGVQILIGEEGDVSTVDVKDGRLRFSDLSFLFDGDQKNASGAAFKWVLENQQLQKNRLPFQVLHQARSSGPIKAEGRVSLTRGWDFSTVWSLRANGINFKASDLKEQFDPRSEGSIVFNLAFDGGYEVGNFYSSGFQLKVDAKDTMLLSKDHVVKKAASQKAQLQMMFDVRENLLTLKPSFMEWGDFRVDFDGRLENLSDYLLRNGESPFEIASHTARIDISKIAPLLGFLRQNPVPSGVVEFSGAMSGALGKKTLSQQLNDRELAWRIDHLSLADFEAGLDSGVWFADAKKNGNLLEGVVKSDLSLRARGRGYLVQTSSMQADVDLTDSLVVWNDEFRKPSGIPGQLKLSLTSVPNKIDVKSSRLRLLDNDVNFSGILNQGSRSRIALSFQKPVDLAKWRPFFRSREDILLEGKVKPTLYLSLMAGPDKMDGGIDWRRVGFAGDVEFQNMSGAHGLLASLDKASGHLRLADGKIYLRKLSSTLAGQKYLIDGYLQPRGQKGAISFYDLAAAKDWNAELKIAVDDVELSKLLKSVYPPLAKIDRERPNTSLAPKTWLEPKEIAVLKKWPLLSRLHLRSTWAIGRLQVGPWTLGKVVASLNYDKDVVKYSLASASWSGGSALSGAGVWEFHPRGGSTGGLPMNGTWNWKRAPLGELLARWDLRESKVFKGQYTGSVVYAIEKSADPLLADLTRMNLDGVVTKADHAVMRVLSNGTREVLQDLGVQASCFANQWQGSLKAWTAGDGSLKVDEANWTGDGTQVKWSIRADKSESATVVGEWLPATECLGEAVSLCWKSAQKESADVGRFVLSGPWDKLNLSWTQGVWATVRECLRPKMAEAVQRKNAASESVDAQGLKSYFQKNAN